MIQYDIRFRQNEAKINKHKLNEFQTSSNDMVHSYKKVIYAKYMSFFSAGLPWIRLPHVTPVQIQVARKIRKYVTGDLDAQV